MIYVAVPAGAGMPGHEPNFTLYGAPAISPTSATRCEVLTLQVTMLRKPAGATAFTRQTTASFKGSWVSGPVLMVCNLKRVSGEVLSFVPPKSGTDA